MSSREAARPSASVSSVAGSTSVTLAAPRPARHCPAMNCSGVGKASMPDTVGAAGSM